MKGPWVIRLSDGGDTWGQPALVARDSTGKLSFKAPALARTREGHLVAMSLCGGPGNDQYLEQARSFDGGRTWVDLTHYIHVEDGIRHIAATHWQLED